MGLCQRQKAELEGALGQGTAACDLCCRNFWRWLQFQPCLLPSACTPDTPKQGFIFLKHWVFISVCIYSHPAHLQQLYSAEGLSGKATCQQSSLVWVF